MNAETSLERENNTLVTVDDMEKNASPPKQSNTEALLNNSRN